MWFYQDFELNNGMIAYRVEIQAANSHKIVMSFFETLEDVNKYNIDKYLLMDGDRSISLDNSRLIEVDITKKCESEIAQHKWNEDVTFVRLLLQACRQSVKIMAESDYESEDTEAKSKGNKARYSKKKVW